MFSTPAGTKILYNGAAFFGTCSAFAAFWVGVRLPVQHNKQGPYHYHRLAKAAARKAPYLRRLPKMV
ncbi:unnamed protein product [Zymoseptoria tritici ST99CH_1A5]|uniref:Uncharacterized protein n=2 Tax=Zymoseptoria tritici TaxID=1047171 RepID=A0A2H1G5L7_ZYMTR|nr:unnamed protein product [Zymoseptoria tritici ST99CH_1E4]SMR50037.1 unnamed protein product [Zymoseptoria tritici ST99CH_3D1]SMY22736.1 unnamed protein product [Zymoseptoria tritici ST99CH_1A5]